MPRARRSTRLPAGDRAKYTTDPFELAGVSGDSDTDPSAVKTKKEKGDDDSDDEFQEAPDDEGDMEVEAEEEAEEEEEADSEDEEDPSIMDTGEPTPAKKKGKATTSQPRYTKQRRPDGAIALKGDETHIRGILNRSENSSKMLHLQLSFGSDERDLLAITYARDRWAKGIDSGFPTRASLNAAETAPDYTYGPTFGADPEDVKKETTRGWDWYYDGEVGEGFRKRQCTTKIEEYEGHRIYMPQAKPGKHTILAGPADDQKRFTLGQYESINFGEAWSEREVKNRPSSNKNSEDTARKPREGWILNLGHKIQTMAWAPNQDGLVQYLAIVTPITDGQKSDYPDPLADKVATAFRPSAPYPSALQIWAFKAKREDSLTKTLDMEFKPRLRLALCTDWGDLRRISWCTIPRAKRDEDDEDVLKNIGLMAGIWGDGCVRVLDIKTNRDPNATEFYKVVSPVFTAKTPSTICTCMAWLSPTDIAVGCANGFVAVWSILSSSQGSSSKHPLPYFYQQIHSTYILSITSAYPTHPHLLCTTSMDREARLTSLLDHKKDMVETNRMRVGPPHISYSPWLHSFVTSDENDFVRLLNLRRFFATSAVARMSSPASALAPCSPCHPSILMGCTGGSVIATNPLRRLLHSKEKQWQQTWFAHEWVQGPEAGSSGVSRFHDGFRAESISLLRNTMGDRKLVNGVMIVTIFEEGTHITSVSWNPNQICAGWASAGMGCGLVRVEDLALSYFSSIVKSQETVLYAKYFNAMGEWLKRDAALASRLPFWGSTCDEFTTPEPSYYFI